MSQVEEHGTNQSNYCRLVIQHGSILFELNTMGNDVREKRIVFSTYGWHWWVIFITLEGNFDDGRPETIAALLVGKDKEVKIKM